MRFWPVLRARHRALLFCLGLLQMACCVPASALDPMFVKVFPAKGSLELTLHDDIQSSLYVWPRTLLTYPVDFPHRSCKAAELQMTGDKGANVPFQLSEVKASADGTLSFAKVNFFSALEPGATHSFNLDCVQNATRASGPAVHIAHGSQSWVVDTGLLRIRLPDTQTVGEGTSVPGPLMALDRGQGWIGGSTLLSQGPKVQRIETTMLESGPLFARYRVKYIFDGDQVYEATLRAVLGYPFVEFSEHMRGLTPEMHVAVEMDWSGLHPDKRYGANGWNEPNGPIAIDKPLSTPGIMEEPYWYAQDQSEDTSKEMFFHLAAFAGNAPRNEVPVMSFWESAEKGQELSVFVPDTKEWDDHQYMVWQPTARLRVAFRYTEGHLIWRWPLIEGERKTDIALTATKTGESVTESVRQLYLAAGKGAHGAFAQNTNFPTPLEQRYGQWLRSWYGALNLDHVKDWKLEYPSSLQPPPPAYLSASVYTSQTKIKLLGPPSTPSIDLLGFVHASPLMNYPLGLDLGVMNISHRVVRNIIEKYMQIRPEMDETTRKKIDAVLLLSAYLNAGEDLAPVRICITGTPNMSADGFSVPAELSVLYPQHPMAKEWAEQFEKTIQLQAMFYTRPDVAAYQSRGGRWTESLAIYNWGYFAPTLAAQISLSHADGKNRLANALMAKRGAWMVDELSAPVWNPNPLWRVGQTTRPTQGSPWKSGIALTHANGFERQYPPHGAHSSGTGGVVPNDAEVVAHYLRKYDPLVAEHLLWAYAQRTSPFQGEGDEPYWQTEILKAEQKNTGTNPHLKSEKYTGHGIVLRAGVDTPDELSIHLDQVDQGPNYRWGNNGEGSSGVLYFYASGQPWSGHEQENTGDHSNDDATGTTTFAVLHDHAWRSIGENVLDRPLYDLGLAQFGEIDSRHDHMPYSWPGYRSRSVMLVGTDYMILGDDAEGETRFTWFTAKDLSFPKIVFLQPILNRVDHWDQITTRMSKGFVRDAIGASVVLVTAKKNEVEMERMHSVPLAFPDLTGLSQYTWDRGFNPTTNPGVYFIRTATSHDRVFRSFQPIHYQAKDEEFSGMAGVIRYRNNGVTEVALIQGESIAAKGVRLQLGQNAEAAISARIEGSSIHGIFQAQLPASLTAQLPPHSDASLVCYIDGSRAVYTRDGDTISVELAPGHHEWEITSSAPTPIAPQIERTVNGKGVAQVYFGFVAGAVQYRAELSADGGATWKPATTVKAGPITVNGLHAGTKVHVRIVAINEDGDAVPGNEYPIYMTETALDTPDGLALETATDRVNLAWGEVLGASEYRLYRRLVGQSTWTMVYHGLARSFDDLAKDVTPPAYMPGRADNALRNETDPIYEYVVTAVNEIGESAKSFAVSTDPAGWLAWWPQGVPRHFKRQTGFWLPPYVPTEMSPPLYYPN
ncbi:MAG TPA: hypothetical protein VGB94_12110 [Acidobacteriaceae bacterium]